MVKFMSGLLALLSFLYICYFFSGSGGQFSFFQLNPVNAMSNLAFAFSFGGGVPVILSYMLSILMIVGIPVLIYRLLYRLLQWLSHA